MSACFACGFATMEKASSRKSLRRAAAPDIGGLQGMRERAKRIGARLEFWSEAGAGTEVELSIPSSIAYEPARNGRRFPLLRGKKANS